MILHNIVLKHARVCGVWQYNRLKSKNIWRKLNSLVFDCSLCAELAIIFKIYQTQVLQCYSSNFSCWYRIPPLGLYFCHIWLPFQSQLYLYSSKMSHYDRIFKMLSKNNETFVQFQICKWNMILCLNKKAYLVQRFSVSNFYWFKSQKFHVTFFTKFLPQCFLLVSVDFLLFKHKNGWDGWVNFQQMTNKNTNGISWKNSCLKFCMNHVAQKYSRLLCFLM